MANDYLDACARNGHHHDLDALADCRQPGATLAHAAASPTFCEHARPAESCVVHATSGVRPPMPAPLARCKSCLGYHGKTGRDRCPYSRKEAAAVKASRAAVTTSAETAEMATRSRRPPVADPGKIQSNDLAGLPSIISHLANASKRLRRKPGRPATGTSKWARLRRNQ